MELKGNILYGQSGGPTSVINTSFYGLVMEASKNSDKIDKFYSMKYGIEGLLNEELIEIDFKNYTKYQKLLNTSGAYFGSNRYKLKDFSKDETDYIKILEIFKKYNIRYFFYNGGNDSMDTINKISRYLKLKNYDCQCLGIPKTIDNDLMHTDFSFGFPSAAKFVINSIINIYNDDASYKVGRVNIVEVMGRNVGWLTASSYFLKTIGIDVDLIYLPEFIFNIDEFLNKVNEIYSKKKHCLVVVSEGIKNKNNELIYEANSSLDVFSHHSLGGVSHYLASLVESKFNFKVRSIELSLLQRANSFSPSKTEQDLALSSSSFLLKEAFNNKDLNQKMLTINYDENNSSYKFDFADISLVANKERKIDDKYLDYKNKNVTNEFSSYIKRLNKGKLDTFSEEGYIDFLSK